MSLKWLANNVSKWGGTYGFPYIFFEDPAEGYVNTKNGSVRAYTREEWQAAREHLADEGKSVTWSGRISLAGNHELADERMDAIAQNGNDGLHYNPEDVAFVRAEGKQPHYQDATGEDWIDEAARTFTPEEFRGAMRFSIGKYNRRMGKKDDLVKEIEKMRDYCQRWIDVEKSR